MASRGNVIFFGAQVIRNLVMASLLGPFYFGVWNLGLVLLQYAQSSHLGVLNAFRLDGARCLGAGDIVKFSKQQRLTWTVTILAALVVSLVAGVIALSWGDWDGRLAILVLALCLVPSQWYQFSISSLTVEERFSISSRLQIIFAVLNLVMTLGLGLLWGFGGVLIAQVVSYALALFAFRTRTPLVFSPLVEQNLLFEQLRIGFPVWLNGILYTLFIAIDRTLIPIGLGMTALGQYSLTALARSSIGLIPSSVSEVVYMRASTEYGASGRQVPPLRLILQANQLIAYFSALPIGLAVLWTPLIVRLILPAYEPGIHALQIFLLGLFFLFPNYGGTLLTVIGHAGEASVILGLAAALQVGLVFIGMSIAGLEGVAIATVASSAFYFAMVNWWGLSRFVQGYEAFSHLITCIIPFVAMSIGLGGALYLTRYLGRDVMDLTRAFLSSVILMAMMVPVVSWGIGHLPARARGTYL
jgi:O-antigen/teichoic acid export membrane protein